MSRIDRIGKTVLISPVHERLTNAYETAMVQHDFDVAIGVAAAGIIIEQEFGESLIMESIWRDRRERAKRRDAIPMPELVSIEPEAVRAD